MDNAQELIQRLNHSGKKLSKSHRRIAECIVTHYDKVVFMTASKLGEYVGVSESTVVRFASALGYSGYPHLQKALQELIRHRLTASQRFEMTSDMDHAQVLNKVLKADIQNIRSTLDEMDINAFEDVANGFVAVRNIASVVCVALIAILFIVSMFIISNTIKLTTFDRREEIAIMKMVGATNGFIRWPFVYEGFLLGLFSAVIGFFLQWGLYEAVARSVESNATINLISIVPFMDMWQYVAAVFAAAGMLIGVGGSLSAIRKFLMV
jgi:cell division protein FtsX